MQESLPTIRSADKLSEQELETQIERLSRKLRDAIAHYGSLYLGERPDLPEHAERTRSYTKAYAGNLLPKEAELAALMHDIIDRFLHEESPKCTDTRQLPTADILFDLLTDPSLTQEQSIYLRHVMVDLIRTEKTSGEHRIQMATDASPHHTADQTAMLSERYSGQIPAEIWREIQPFIDFKLMGEFLKSVNVESVIIKAVELYDNMKQPSSQRESALLQDVLEAESFYAPICEVMGLDGVASSLRDISHQTRLKKQGKTEIIEQARERLALIESIGTERIVANVMCENNEVALSPAVGIDECSKTTPITIGEFAVAPRGRKAVAGNYRLKTVGSLANKMDTKNEEPMDLFGMTIIVDNEDELAEEYAGFIARSHANRLHEAKKAPSKTEPYYVTGNEAFIGKVKNACAIGSVELGEHTIQVDEITDDIIAEKGYTPISVAKTTLNISITDNETGEPVIIPAEVQFVTKEERRRMRVGEVAHIIFKYLKTIENSATITTEERKKIIRQAVDVLEMMYDRVTHVAPNELTINKSDVAARLVSELDEKLESTFFAPNL